MADESKRAQERSKVMLMVAVRFAGASQVHRLRVRDIAAGGVRLSCASDVVPGDHVWIEFAAIGEVAGTVAWAANGEIGVRFACAIDPELARLPVSGDFRPSAIAQPARGLRRV